MGIRVEWDKQLIIWKMDVLVMLFPWYVRYIYACDCLELLMCTMSVQDILAGKSNGETRLNPMYQTVEAKVESDERWKLHCLYFICVVV